MDKSPLMFESDEDSLLNGPSDSENTEKNNSSNSMITANSNEHKILKNLQTVLMGIPPPPAFTVPQLDAREILKLWKDHKNYRAVPSPGKIAESKNNAEFKEMEVKNAKWPEVLRSEHHDVYYNKSASSEEVARLCVRYKERYVGAETSSSVNALFVRSPSRTASARKRARNRAWGHSPGRRLSHLARRRKAFSSASLCSVAGNNNPDKKMIMVEIKKIGNRQQKKKNSAKKTKPTPKKKKKSPEDASFKRALFQSPDQMPGKKETQTPNTQAIHRSKRNLFIESSGEKGINENGKRVQPIVRRMSPRKRVNRSLSFQDSGPIFQQPTSAPLNQNILTGAHKQKMLWAATNALRDEHMGMNHELFRPCMSILFKACQKLWLTKMLFNQEGSTSENMLKLAKRFSAYTIKEISSDPTSNHMALVCSNIVKMGEKTLDCVESKDISATPKLDYLKKKGEATKDAINENGDSKNVDEAGCSGSKLNKGHLRLRTPVKSSPRRINTPQKSCIFDNETVFQPKNQDCKENNALEERTLENGLDATEFTSPVTRSRSALLLKNTPTKPGPSNPISISSTNTKTSRPKDVKKNEDVMNLLGFTSPEMQLKIALNLRKTPKKSCQTVNQDVKSVGPIEMETKTPDYISPVTRSKTIHSSRNTPKKPEINPSDMCYTKKSDQMAHLDEPEPLENSLISTDSSSRLTKSRKSCGFINTLTKPTHLKQFLLESPNQSLEETKQSGNNINLPVLVSSSKSVVKRQSSGNTPNKQYPTKSSLSLMSDSESMQSHKNQCVEEKLPIESKINQPDSISSTKPKSEHGSEHIQEFQSHSDSSFNCDLATLTSNINTDSKETKPLDIKVKSPDISPTTRSRKTGHSKSTNLSTTQSNKNSFSEIKSVDNKASSPDIISPTTRSSKAFQRKSIQSNHISCSGQIDPSDNVESSFDIIPPTTSSKANRSRNAQTKQNLSDSIGNFSSSTIEQNRFKETKPVESMINSLPDLISPTTRLRNAQNYRDISQKTSSSDFSVTNASRSVQCDIVVNSEENEQSKNKTDSPYCISPRLRLRSYDHSKVTPTSVLGTTVEKSVGNSFSVNSILKKTPAKAKQRTKRLKSRMLSDTRMKISTEFVDSPLKSSVVSIYKLVDINEAPNQRKTPSKVRFDLEDSSKSTTISNRIISFDEEQKPSFNFEAASNSPDFTFPTTRSRSASLNSENLIALCLNKSPIPNRLDNDLIGPENSTFSNPHTSKKSRCKKFCQDSRLFEQSDCSDLSGIDTEGSLGQKSDRLEDNVEIGSENNKENLGSEQLFDVAKSFTRSLSSQRHLSSVENNVSCDLQLYNPSNNEGELAQANLSPAIRLEPPTLTAHWEQHSGDTSESECAPSLTPHWEQSPGNNTRLPDSIMAHWQPMTNKTISDKIMFDFEDESYEINLASDDDTKASSVCAPFEFPLVIDDSRSGFPSVFRRDSRDSFN